MRLENLFNAELEGRYIQIISIDLTHLDFSVVRNMKSAFKGCSSLQIINFPNFGEINKNQNYNLYFQ